MPSSSEMLTEFNEFIPIFTEVNERNFYWNRHEYKFNVHNEASCKIIANRFVFQTCTLFWPISRNGNDETFYGLEYIA